MIWIALAIAGLGLLFGAVFFGAPYVPTRRQDADKALGQLGKRDVLVDLGSGDGVLLLAAAKKGIKSYGIELNPFLVLVSRLRLRQYRDLTSVSLGNYWRSPLPDDATAVFVFLAQPYMEKLRVYMEAEATRLGRPLTLVSYGFELPGHRMKRQDGAVLVYNIPPRKP